jgi:four helix bundle protein
MDENEYEGPGHGAILDHERLEVYHVALEFLAWATDLIACSKGEADVRVGPVCDHLDRASLSILLNIAEGNGKRQMKTRAKFFDDARGSATECAACLDALVAKRVCDEGQVRQGKFLIVRIVSMLCKLVDRYDTDREVREDDGEYPAAACAPANRPRPSFSSSCSKVGRNRASSTTRTDDDEHEGEPPTPEPNRPRPSFSSSYSTKRRRQESTTSTTDDHEYEGKEPMATVRRTGGHP